MKLVNDILTFSDEQAFELEIVTFANEWKSLQFSGYFIHNKICCQEHAKFPIVFIEKAL